MYVVKINKSESIFRLWIGCFKQNRNKNATRGNEMKDMKRKEYETKDSKTFTHPFEMKQKEKETGIF